MKPKNRLTRFVRVLVHIGWYLTLIFSALIPVVFVGSELGWIDAVNDYNIGLEWEMDAVPAVDGIHLKVSDQSGREYPVSGLEGKGRVNFAWHDGMGATRYPFFLLFAPVVACGLWGIYQLKRLFDNLADGCYFEEVNATRIRRIAYSLFAIEADRILVAVVLESMFRVESGPLLDVGGVEFGLNPMVLSGLILLILGQVFQEGARLETESRLTV